MVAVTITYLLLLALDKAFCYSNQFLKMLPSIDVTILDEQTYDNLVLEGNFIDEENISFILDLAESTNYVSIEDSINPLESSLIALPFQRINKTRDCDKRASYIKDPYWTYVIDAGSETWQDVKDFLLEQFTTCEYQNQPYSFVFCQQTSYKSSLSEVQFYSGKLIPILNVDGNSSVDFIEEAIPVSKRRKDFSGAIIHASRDYYMPFFGFAGPNNTQWIGVNGELASMFQDEYNVTLYLVDGTGTGSMDSNGSWSGMMGRMLEGTVDVCMGDLTHTRERLAYVDGLVTLRVEHALAYYWKQSSSSSSNFNALATVFKVFDLSFWIVLAAVSLFSSIFLNFLMAKVQAKSKMVGLFPQALTVVLRTIGSIGFDLDLIDNVSGRRRNSLAIWLFTCSLTGTMLFWVYNGCLTSFMAVPEANPPFKSLADLAQKPNFKLLIQAQGSREQLFLANAQKDDIVKKVWETNVEPWRMHKDQGWWADLMKEKFLDIPDSEKNKVAMYVYHIDMPAAVKACKKLKVT